jgi:hypothetical protein
MKKKEENQYLSWVKDELKQHNIRVHRWGEFKEDEIYYAYFDTRRVYIPVPKCDYSFLVSLHEIGHIVSGDSFYGHIAEYNAERWAIHRAKVNYGIISQSFEESGKEYIYENLIEDMVFREFNYEQLDPNIKRWIKVPKKTTLRDAEELYTYVKTAHLN